MRSLTQLVFLICGLLALFPVCMSAQLTVGLGGGLVSSTITGDDVDDDELDSKTGFSFGAWLAIPVRGPVSIVPGILYAQKGATDNSPGVDGEISINYVEIPVVLSVNLTGPESPVRFNLFGGPSVAFNTSCEAISSEGGVTVSADCDEFASTGSAVKTLDFGAVVGAGITIPAGESLFIFGNGGVDLGLTSFDDTDDPDHIKNRALFLSLGIVIPLG